MDFVLQNKKIQDKKLQSTNAGENTVRTISEQINTSSANGEKIFLIYQFFLSPDIVRMEEMRTCLNKNIKNNIFNKIYLLNERIYTREEMGLQQYSYEIINQRIKQIDFGNRLKFKDIYDFVETERLLGFVVFINSDIFFDESIKILNRSNLHLHKSMIGLLRYEYRKYMIDLKDSRLFGPRGDSQDTWIFHSDYNIVKKHRNAFNFYFGQPGCDNKLLYLYKILGYKIYNDPSTIRTYHLHASVERNYSKNGLHEPFLVSMPYRSDGYGNGQHNIFNSDTRFNMENDNNVLNKYLIDTISSGKHFIIPRIAGIENNYALMGEHIDRHNGIVPNEYTTYIQNTIPTMKNNAGIQLSDMESIICYSKMYLDAFKKCDIYTDWEPYGNVYRGIIESHDFITKQIAVDKKPIWARTLDIFDYIYANPWTINIGKKRILIISSFVDTIEQNMPNAHDIYGIDLFPGCDFVYLKPPQTNGKNISKDFREELSNFCQKISSIKDTFDIALVSCGGYGNLVCSHIYDLEKSSIYVGGTLQMYFGILGTRWKRERPDILKLYMNDFWHIPTAQERPAGFEQIEKSCYW